MDSNLVHAAVAAYQEEADPAEASRLAFFEGLLDIQQERADFVAAQNGWHAPEAAQIVALYRAPEGVFSQVPVALEAADFAQTCQQIASYMADHAGLDDAATRALQAFDWNAFCARVDLVRAGTDPASFIEETLAHIDSFDVSADLPANVLMMVPAFALRAHLQPAAEAAVAAYQDADDHHSFERSVDCPVCGSPATASWVGESAASDGRGRMQYCAMCGTQWNFDRIRCGNCGTRSTSHLHYFNVAGDPAHRLQRCDDCGGYQRVVFREDMKVQPFAMEVEDVVMARLDEIAHDPRFQNAPTYDV